MIRPEVRVVQPQEETISPAQIDQWEAEQLLRKYGHVTEIPTQSPPPPSQGMTFEEMVASEEARKSMERQKALQRQNGVRPISFDGRNDYHSETRYSTDEDSGFGFKVQITSDMPIPKY